MKSNTTLSAVQLRQAADLADSIERQQNQLTALLSGQPVKFGGRKPKADGTLPKRVFSPEVRAKIAAGQKARWAKQKAEQAAGTNQKPSDATKPQTPKAPKVPAEAMAKA